MKPQDAAIRALRVVGEDEVLVAPPRRRSAKDVVPFGQYKGRDLAELLDDIPYCSWLVEQQWCRNKFPAILRAAQAAVAAYEQNDAGQAVDGAPVTPQDVWVALSPDQRVAVRVCAPALAAALEAAG